MNKAIKVYNRNKNLVGYIKDLTEFYIKKELGLGDESLRFNISIKNTSAHLLELEGYLRTKDQEYIIKELQPDLNNIKVVALLNVESIEEKFFTHFETVGETVEDATNLALAGTGWKVIESNVNKRRTVRKERAYSWDILKDIKNIYNCDFILNSIEKTIRILDRRGSFKGEYIMENINLIDIQAQSDSYDFYTRLVAEGKDGMTFANINGGKPYVEDFSYSNKIKTYYWKDERYIEQESLLEDAIIKLNDMSKPRRAYNVECCKLGNVDLGDEILLISKTLKIKEKQRISSITIFPNEENRNYCEISNQLYNIEDLNLKFEQAADKVDDITTEAGNIDGSVVEDLPVENIKDFKKEVGHLVADKADIGSLNAIKADIGELNATKANITELEAVKGDFKEIESEVAKIGNLEAGVAKVDILESNFANIEEILAGNITADNISTELLSVIRGWMLEASIGDAQISNLNANKLTSGTIDTSKIDIAGPNNRMIMRGNKLQVLDFINGSTLFERIFLGIDDNNKAQLVIRASDGQTVLIDSEGVHEAGITQGAVTTDKLGDSAVTGNKVDINSIITKYNEDGTVKIGQTKIQVGDKTLDVVLSEKSQFETETTKKLNDQQASITANQNAIKLKVDTQTYVTDRNTINSNIENVKNDVDTVSKNLKTTSSAVDLLKDQINLKVEQSDINTAVTEVNKKIDNIQVGGTNLLNNSDRVVGETATREFVSHNDVAPIFDKYGLIEYTISFDIKSKDTSKSNAIQVYGQNGTGARHGFSQYITVSTEWERKHITVIPTLLDETITQTLLSFYGTYNTGNIPVVKNVKVEKGNKATDYSVSPEDIKSAIEEKALKTDVYVKAETYSKAETNAQINIAKDSIKQEVSQTYETKSNVTAQINTTKVYADTKKAEAIEEGRKVIDTRTVNSAPSWYFENYPRQTIVEFKQRTTMGLPSGLTGNYGTVTTNTPWQDASGGLPVQTWRSQDTPTFERKAISTTTWGAWKQVEDVEGSQAKVNVVKTELNAEITTVKNKTATLETNLNGITGRVTATENTTVDLRTKTEIANAIARAMAKGKLLRTDPMFKTSVNGCLVYNNMGNGNVLISRLARPSDCPTSSPYCLEIKTIGVAAPSHGGFYNLVTGRPNAKFIIRIVAKIPEGRSLMLAGNLMGTGATDKFLTSNAGTGKYTEYIREITCGAEGSFSNSGHFYISGGATPTEAQPLIWYVASIEVYDVTDIDYTVQDAVTQVNANKQQIAETKTQLGEITNRVSTAESNIIKTNGNVTSNTNRITSAETKLTDSNFQIQIGSNVNKVYSFRYIRDWVSGSSYNTGNHWVEIKAINNQGVNVAQGKTVTASATIGGATTVTDGLVDKNYASVTGTPAWVQVDLGQIYSDIDMLKIWHFWSDARVYNNTKTQISSDGVNWITVFDSSIAGTYAESQAGHTIKLNHTGMSTATADFNEKGLTVRHTDAGTYTKMSADGFKIFRGSDNEEIGSLAEETGMSILKASKVYASNIKTLYEPWGTVSNDTEVIYVTMGNTNSVQDGKTSATAYSSMNQMLADRFYSSRSLIIQNQIQVQLQGSGEFVDSFKIAEFNGTGGIEIVLAKTLTLLLSAPIGVQDNTLEYVRFTGLKTNISTNDGAILNCARVSNNRCFELNNAGKVQIRNLRITGRTISEGYCVISYGSTNTTVMDCDVSNFYIGFHTSEGSHLYLQECCGNNIEYLFNSNYAGIIVYGDANRTTNRPSCNRVETYAKTGIIQGFGTVNAKASLYSPPPTPPTTTYTNEWALTSWSYSSSGYWQDTKDIYQGNYGYGNHRGYMLPPSACKSAISGSTINSARLYIRRKNGGGSSGAVDLYLWGSTQSSLGSGTPATPTQNYGKIGSLAWGQSATFTIPTNAINHLKAGTINSLCLYTSDGSNYFRSDGQCAKLSITYTK